MLDFQKPGIEITYNTGLRIRGLDESLTPELMDTTLRSILLLTPEQQTQPDIIFIMSAYGIREKNIFCILFYTDETSQILIYICCKGEIGNTSTGEIGSAIFKKTLEKIEENTLSYEIGKFPHEQSM
jgi:hypothetical protein